MHQPTTIMKPKSLRETLLKLQNELRELLNLQDHVVKDEEALDTAFADEGSHDYDTIRKHVSHREWAKGIMVRHCFNAMLLTNRLEFNVMQLRDSPQVELLAYFVNWPSLWTEVDGASDITHFNSLFDRCEFEQPDPNFESIVHHYVNDVPNDELLTNDSGCDVTDAINNVQYWINKLQRETE
jgi:hypothetical protein